MIALCMEDPMLLRPEQRNQDQMEHPKQNRLRSPAFILIYGKDTQGRMKYRKYRKTVHGKNKVYENSYHLLKK